MTAPAWETTSWDGGDHVHVLPLGDVVEHEERNDGECVCGPAVEYVARPDGSGGWLFTHHSADGRELSEPDRRTA